MKRMKRSALLIIVLTVIFFTIPTAQAANTTASLSGIQVFPKDYIWKVPIDTLPVHPMSNTYIISSNPGAWMFLATNYPINVVNRTQAKQYLTYIKYSDYSDNVPYPIPDNPLIEDGIDKHMIIIDTDANLEYDLYKATNAANGTWSAYSAVVHNLSSYTLRPYGANIAGMPLVPGIIRYEEVAAGQINHATAFTIKISRNGPVWPARAGDPEKDPTYPPFGQRYRLKSTFNTSGYTPQMKTILDAWKKYGLMLEMNSGGDTAWGFLADTDPRWDNPPDGGYGPDSIYTQLKGIHGSDFEAVDATVLMIDEDSGQARITPILTPEPTHPNAIPPAAAFTGTPVTGTEPLGVTFTDSSTGTSITNWCWDFGDGNSTNYSVSTHPFHSYTSAGLKSVNLTVIGTGGTDSEVKTSYLNVTAAPEANATASKIGTYNPTLSIWCLDYNGNCIWEYVPLLFFSPSIRR